MRVAGVRTLEQANEYRMKDYRVWWERELTVEAANPDDAHRPLEKGQDLAAADQPPAARPVKAAQAHRASGRGSDWNKSFDLKKGPKMWQAAQASGCWREEVDGTRGECGRCRGRPTQSARRALPAKVQVWGAPEKRPQWRCGRGGGCGANSGANSLRAPRGAWKIGTALREDDFHRGGREARQQQFCGDPEVGDTPIRRGKTLRDAEAVQATLIDGGSTAHRDGWGHGTVACSVLQSLPGRRREGRQRALSRLQQRGALAGQARRGLSKFHPGSQSAGQTPAWFLIAASCQPAHLPPSGAGGVAVIPARQLAADALATAGGSDCLLTCTPAWR